MPRILPVIGGGLVDPVELLRTKKCPECNLVSTRLLRNPCAGCGVLLIPTQGMPTQLPSGRAYKQDEDGSWRLAYDPDRDGRR